MSKPALYGATLSPFVRKIKVMLLEKKIDHDHESITPFEKTPEFLKASPLGKIPYLKDANGRTVNDSSIIAMFLEESYPENPLFPEDPYERAQVRWLEEYMDTEIATLVFGLFGQKIVRAMFMGEAVDEEVVKAAEEKAPSVLEYLESQIHGKQFFVANMLTIADISIASAFCNLKHVDFTIDSDKFPELANWFERIVQRESFSGIMAAETEMLNKTREKAKS